MSSSSLSGPPAPSSSASVVALGLDLTYMAFHRGYGHPDARLNWCLSVSNRVDQSWIQVCTFAV